MQVSLLFTTENGQGFIFFEELNAAFFCHQQKKKPENRVLFCSISSSRTHDTYITMLTMKTDICVSRKGKHFIMLFVTSVVLQIYLYQNNEKWKENQLQLL